MHNEIEVEKWPWLNVGALHEWFDQEWERQFSIAKEAADAFDTVRKCKVYGAVDGHDMYMMEDLLDRLNALISTYAPDKKLQLPACLVSASRVREARALIDTLDQIEAAAYDKESLRLLIASSGILWTNPSLPAAICFSVANHLWQMAGGFGTYEKWHSAARDCGWNTKDFDRLKEVLFEKCCIMLHLIQNYKTGALAGCSVPPQFLAQETE